MANFKRRNVRLRKMIDADKHLVLAWRNDERVRQHMYTTHIISEAEHDAWYAKTLTRLDQKHFIFQYNERPVGVASFSIINQHDQTAFWAFYLGETDVPKGTGSVMEFLALNYAFGDLGLFKLSCEVLATNPGVVKMHKRFGFKEEGNFRSHRLREEGRTDVYRLALFNDEWTSLRGKVSTLLFGAETDD